MYKRAHRKRYICYIICDGDRNKIRLIGLQLKFISARQMKKIGFDGPVEFCARDSMRNRKLVYWIRNVCGGIGGTLIASEPICTVCLLGMGGVGVCGYIYIRTTTHK